MRIAKNIILLIPRLMLKILMGVFLVLGILALAVGVSLMAFFEEIFNVKLWNK